MKSPLLCTFISLLVLLSTTKSVEAVVNTIEKTYCTQAIAYPSIETLQLQMLNNAKKEVINELFGELIVSSTAVENSVVTTDQIRASSVGFVRVDGNANFHNGENFAEVCVTISGYLTEDDQSKFEEVQLIYKFCDTDDNLTTNQLKEYVREEAVIQALVEYNRQLDGADRTELLRLMKKVTYPESAFVQDTDTYCAKVEGSIVPIEVISFLEGSVEEQDVEEVSTTRSQTVTKGAITKQWVTKVINFSSQYDTKTYSANQVIGSPSVFSCGGSAPAWSLKSANMGIQFIEVEFEQEVYPQRLIVRENNAIGFVTKLVFFDSSGEDQEVEVEDQLDGCPGESEFDVTDQINFPTRQVRVYIDTDHSTGWEEIDAIALQGFTVITDTIRSDETK